MSDEVGRELGNNIGKFIEVDRRARQSDQAKFMRIRVELQLDKPLRRGGKLGHDEKHCKDPSDQQNTKQYGEWLRAQGNPKVGLEKSRSTGSGVREEGSADQFEGNNLTTTKLSSASVSDEGHGSDGKENRNSSTSNSKNFEPHEVSNGDRAHGVTCTHSTQMEQPTVGVSEARVVQNYSLNTLMCGLRENKSMAKAFSLVGQQAHLEKEEIEVNSLSKPVVSKMGKKEGMAEVTG
nr:hypothetical protein CFP56_56200 [Quercus suber]